MGLAVRFAGKSRDRKRKGWEGFEQIGKGEPREARQKVEGHRQIRWR